MSRNLHICGGRDEGGCNARQRQGYTETRLADAYMFQALHSGSFVSYPRRQEHELAQTMAIKTQNNAIEWL